jgi:hypothetical protein
MLTLTKPYGYNSFAAASAGSGDLNECLRSPDCILPPDVLDIVRRYSGCNLAAASASLPGTIVL